MIDKAINKMVFLAAWLMACQFVLAENLYNEQQFKPIVADSTAYKVGDALTLLIVEVSKAKSNSDASVNKSIGVTGNVGKSSKEEKGSVDAGIKRESDGATAREGQLRASLTVAVIEVDEIGKLRVKGNQSIIVNGEKQLISVDGWVRPEDIDAQNYVLSTRLVDAKIEYTGEGMGADAHKPGFFYWLLDKIGII